MRAERRRDCQGSSFGPSGRRLCVLSSVVDRGRAKPRLHVPLSRLPSKQDGGRGATVGQRTRTSLALSKEAFRLVEQTSAHALEILAAGEQERVVCAGGCCN